jgi:hypothetical protein
MGKSIITEDMHTCMICGTTRNIERHHVCFGTADRKISDKYGLIVPLCSDCHRGRNSVHQCRAVDLKMKQLAQRTFEGKYSREKWMELFRRNYL